MDLSGFSNRHIMETIVIKTIKNFIKFPPRHRGLVLSLYLLFLPVPAMPHFWTLGSQMSRKKIFDEDPGSTDGFRVVILSFIEEWLRVTVVRTRINEYFALSFRLSHGGEKIDSRLRGTSVFAAGNYQDGIIESVELFCIYFVEAEPVNEDARARFRIVQICMERFRPPMLNPMVASFLPGLL